MSGANELLQAYLADDPNLIPQPAATDNGANGLQPENAQPGQDNVQDTATVINATPCVTNATPDVTNVVAEGREQDVEMTNVQRPPGEAVTNIGSVFGGLIPSTWFTPRSDNETRKRKERSPSLVAATDGGEQSVDTAGAHKKLRGSSPTQEAENSAVDSQDSTARPCGSEGDAPEQALDPQSMPGALSVTSVESAPPQSMTSADRSPGTLTGPPSTTNGISVANAAGLTLVAANNTSVSGRSHASPASEVTGSSEGHVPPATSTTPLGSPSKATTGTRPMPAKDKMPSRDPLSPVERSSQKLPDTMKSRTTLLRERGRGGSADRSLPPPAAPTGASTNASSPSSSSTSNGPDPWAVLAQQFDGVRTDIQSMSTHMRTMNNNIGRLDNAVGIMAEQHTELMSVLRMGFAAAGQPPAPHQTFPPGQPPAPGHPPAATAGQLSLVTVPPPTGPRATAANLQPPASIPSRPPRRQIHATTSSHMSTPSSSRNRPSRAQASSDDDMEVDEGARADTEEDIPEPLPVVVKTSKLKLKGMPKTRDPNRKALLDDIALTARKYMGREPDPDDDEDCDVLFFDETKVPSRDDVGKFTGRDGQCCTIDDFRPDLLGTPRSTWNQSVAQVFAKQYVKATTAKSKDVAEVQRAFGVHMKTLINSFKTFQASRTDNDAKRRKRRRYMRKSYAHERRMLTVASHDGLKHHLWILQALGVQGMSSDESEHEGTQVRYRRTTLVWRNPTLETFLRVIDVFHEASRFTTGVDRSSKSGAHVHLRLPAQKISERAAVPGLPLAAYDPAWLKTLSDFFRNMLNISNVQYHFEHSPEVMKEMMQVLRPPPSDQTQPTIPPLL